VFYDLIESQTRVSMLADVRDEYVFQVVDPAMVPDEKVAPRRSLIAVLGTLLGGMLGVVIVLVRHYVSSSAESRRANQVSATGASRTPTRLT